MAAVDEMIRYQIRHDRDPMTHPGFHWNLFEVDTNDPKAPVFVGFGSHEACLAHAVRLVELWRRTRLTR
jgi:hypothetical protein